MIKTFSLGHIANSRAHASLEIRPLIYGPKWWIKFGRTYNGTFAGVVVGLGVGVFMAHVRSRQCR